jgi:hypothetical protein
MDHFRLRLMYKERKTMEYGAIWICSVLFLLLFLPSFLIGRFIWRISFSGFFSSGFVTFTFVTTVGIQYGRICFSVVSGRFLLLSSVFWAQGLILFRRFYLASHCINHHCLYRFTLHNTTLLRFSVYRIPFPRKFIHARSGPLRFTRNPYFLHRQFPFSVCRTEYDTLFSVYMLVS